MTVEKRKKEKKGKEEEYGGEKKKKGHCGQPGFCVVDSFFTFAFFPSSVPCQEQQKESANNVLVLADA